MNKIKPIIIMTFLLLIIVVSWKNVVEYNGNIEKSYNMHIEKAEDFMNKQIYIDAVSEYESALKINNDDFETAMIIVDLYDKLDNETAFVQACKNAIKIDSSQEKPYIVLADYYITNRRLKDAMSILEDAKLSIEDTNNINSRIINLKSQYKIENLQYDVVHEFCSPNLSDSEYSVVELGDKKGLIDEDLDVIIDVTYDNIGLLCQAVIPVCKDNEWYYIDDNGYRKLVPDNPATYLGVFNDGYAPACINGKYGYIDKEMKEYDFNYDFTGNFANNIAAVMKNNKWAIINSEMKLVTDFIFDDIIVDEYGFCSLVGVFFAKTEDKYYLYNSKGEKISDGFNNAKAFISMEPAAIEIDNKWGFVDINGEIIINPEYSEAESFNIGYAPIKSNNKWGCIDTNCNILISPTFDSMKSFAKNGYSLVKIDGMDKYVVVNLYE